MPVAPRILRSLLFVPGDRAGMIEKAPGYGADALILDLEDAVVPDAKGHARRVVAAALERGIAPGIAVFVRVNSMDSGLLDEDLGTALRSRVDAVCLPKCATPEAVVAMDVRLQVLEDRWRERRGRIGIVPLIESAQGVLNAAAIARAHPRVSALGFGGEDFTADLGVRRTRAGTEVAGARGAVALAAHAAAAEALDGIYADFRDPDGLRADTAAARELGFTGKMIIHPAQVAVVHAAFAPSPQEVDHARRVVAAFEAARARGAGVAVVDGAMIDRPVVLRAERILAIAART